MADEVDRGRRCRRAWIALAAAAGLLYMTLHIVALPGEEIVLGAAVVFATRAATWHGWLIARAGQRP